MNKEPKIFELDVIKTPDGFLTPVYKDWEDWHAGYEVKMAYHTSIGPGISKGPILHERRKGLMSCVSGEVSVVCLVNGILKTYKLVDGEKKYILLIPEGIPNMIINTSQDKEAVILNLPSKAWRPDDEDTVKFKSWEEYFSKYNSNDVNTIIDNGVR